jgi:hypothetical protein
MKKFYKLPEGYILMKLIIKSLKECIFVRLIIELFTTTTFEEFLGNNFKKYTPIRVLSGIVLLFVFGLSISIIFPSPWFVYFTGVFVMVIAINLIVFTLLMLPCYNSKNEVSFVLYNENSTDVEYIKYPGFYFKNPAYYYKPQMDIKVKTISFIPSDIRMATHHTDVNFKIDIKYSVSPLINCEQASELLKRFGDNFNHTYEKKLLSIIKQEFAKMSTINEIVKERICVSNNIAKLSGEQSREFGIIVRKVNIKIINENITILN